ncbi:MAG: lactate utilization protein [Fusobacteriaceae bacterium]|nr:lactate utilization protein [Fusobacteriaceae bacterium]
MKILEEAKLNFKRNNIKLIFFENTNNFYEYINNFIKPNLIVGVGDSVSFEELKFYDYLRNSHINFLDKYSKGLTKEDKKALYIQNFNADIFFSGVNALSSEGKIYNLDGNGSRVAPIIYGPKKVFLVCGVNKLVRTEKEAFDRIKAKAAPLDAIRLNKKTPCVKTKVCMECKSPDKICNYMTIIQGQFDPERIEILVINKEMGY